MTQLTELYYILLLSMSIYLYRILILYAMWWVDYCAEISWSAKTVNGSEENIISKFGTETRTQAAASPSASRFLHFQRTSLSLSRNTADSSVTELQSEAVILLRYTVSTIVDTGSYLGFLLCEARMKGSSYVCNVQKLH